MYNQICKICGAENVEDKHFYKFHKTKISTYYLTTFNKRDQLTGEIIPFYNKLQYLSQDFITRRNLKEWLKRQSLPQKQQYLLELLKKRKEHKDLIYTPTQVELRSLDIMPGILTFNEVFGDYYQLCAEIGFVSRGLKNVEPIFTNNTNKIYCDSREQSPVLIQNMEIKKLNYGDYNAENSDVFVERKSLNDLIGSISMGYERLGNEFSRAEKDKKYIVVMVESNLNDTLNFNYKYAAKFTKASPEFIFHRIRELLQRFTNLQFIFCDGRIDLKNKMLKIFNFSNIREVDLQLLVDKKEF